MTEPSKKWPPYGKEPIMDDVTEMSDAETLAWMGTDAQRWAEAFAQLHPDLGDPNLMIVWFSNAIEAGARRAQRAMEGADLPTIVSNAEIQFDEADRAGELAARRLWAELAGTARQLINMNQRIAEKKAGK